MAGGALCLALMAGLVGVAGCWGGGEAGEPGKGAVREAREALTLRLDAAWGSLIVAPAARLPGVVAAALDSEEARGLAHTDDGRRVDVKVRRLRAEVGTAPALPPTGRRGWMESVGVWSTSEPTAAERGLAGGAAVTAKDGAVQATFAVITMPPGTMGQGVWIGEHRLDVNWLPSSRTVMDRLSSLSWASPLAAGAMESPIVRACLEAERASPFRRWRARMAMGTLSPSEGLGATGGDVEGGTAAAIDAFADAGLELIAAQTEERWAVGLSRLGEVDAGLFDRVRRALVRTARVGGAVVPTWPTDQAALDELLSALLTPRATPRMVRDAAERLLEGLPASVGWIADDAAGVDAATLMPVVVVGAANLTERPQAASVRWAGAVSGFISPELTPVQPGATTRLTAPAIPPDVAGEGGLAAGRGLERLSVRVGDWIGTLRAVPSAAPVQPPGLLMDPMAADWTLAAWANGTTGAAARAPVAVTLLRTPSPNPRERSVGEGWVIYGQAAAGVTGTLRIWLGPAARSRAAIVVDLSAAAAEGEKPEREKPAAEGVKAGGAAGGVRTFSAALPGDAVSAASGWRLMIGLDADVVWKDAEGVERAEHMAWPRPMFPWESAPSRAALDLAAWGGVSAKPPAVIR